MPKVGDQIKYSDLAFFNGVAKAGDQKKRGVIVREARDKELWVIKWDNKKTPDKLNKSFVIKATTGQRLSEIIVP